MANPEWDNYSNKPTIVCLCGSTKFKTVFEDANMLETLDGKIVLSVGCFMHFDKLNITPEQKINLDKLHFKKIELADEVLILNVQGYIGSSTRNELEYATKLGKKIRYWEKQ